MRLFLVMCHLGSPSELRVETGYSDQAAGSTVRCSNAGRGKRFFLLHNVKSNTEAHSASYSLRAGSLSEG